MDGREHELCKSVNSRRPLWGVIDIYGNVKGTVSRSQSDHLVKTLFIII